jgi:hypothetical protein
MFDLTEAYDDLVALRRALAVSEGMVSTTTTRELQALMKFTEARVCVALHAMAEEEREEAIGSLDDLYEGEARVELEEIAAP